MFMLMEWAMANNVINIGVFVIIQKAGNEKSINVSLWEISSQPF